MARTNDYAKMSRYTHGFKKKPSEKQKKWLRKKKNEQLAKRRNSRYTEEQKERYKFGIFYKNGWRSIECFETREQAEKKLATYPHKEYFVVREILCW